MVRTTPENAVADQIVYYELQYAFENKLKIAMNKNT